MSATFWYHPESGSFWINEASVEEDDMVGDGLSNELTEEEWSTGYIKQILENKVLPEGIDGILVEARKTLSFGSGSDIIFGYMWLRKGIPDGTETNTSRVEEYRPGNIIRTKNSTYLVQWAKQKQEPQEPTHG